MTDFDFDVMQRKRVARGAMNRKRGSKSKQCRLSTDYMTNKQWKERCGKMVTMQINQPMTWKDFTELPTSLQKEYVQSLIDRFSTTSTDLAKMFGVHQQTVSTHCKQEDIGIHFRVGQRMTKENRQAFEAFCGKTVNAGMPKVPKAEMILDEPKEENVPEATYEPANTIDESRQAQDMLMEEFTLKFSGRFNREMVYNSLASMLPVGTDVELVVQCHVKK